MRRPEGVKDPPHDGQPVPGRRLLAQDDERKEDVPNEDLSDSEVPPDVEAVPTEDQGVCRPPALPRRVSEVVRLVVRLLPVVRRVVHVEVVEGEREDPVVEEPVPLVEDLAKVEPRPESLRPYWTSSSSSSPRSRWFLAEGGGAWVD